MLDLRQVALPVLRRLARETDETALLTVPSSDRERSVCLERVESSQPLRLSVEPGRRLPLHAGASQKALLAFLGEEEIERVTAGSLEQLCRATFTDAKQLHANLAEIRQRGWAISFEETNVGVWGVAVPLLDERGMAVAALGLAGPSARLSLDEVVDHLEHLRDVAVVTGAAKGLGGAITEVLACDGAHLVLAGRDLEALQSHAARLDDAYPDRESVVATCDVTNEHEVRAMIGAAVERFGGLDILVNTG